ncbi:MAG TPA: oxidoreductase [Chloroflexi bacterium]|nr:oxidoreductase [Chloroflexota bacterium]
MSRYRVALIGTGGIVASHLEAITAHSERLELVAAVDQNAARVESVCAQAGIPRAYTDAEAMLAAEHPDLVHILTPPATHFPLILAALDAGAWVWCEKPLCRSLAEFDQIAAAEQRTGRYVSTVFQWRFGSAVEHLRALAGKHLLGKPLVAVCQTLWYRDAAYYAVPWRGNFSTETGGPTATLGIHLMDLLLWLWGEWDEVQAIVATLDRSIQVEDVSMALVRFQSGALGSIVNSALSPRQESYLRLDYQRATAEVKTLYRYANADWRFTTLAGAEGDALAAAWQAIPCDRIGSHTAQLTALLDSMERSERPLVSGVEARRIVEFIASLYKSAFTRQPVRRGAITPGDPFYTSMNGAPYED